jgi:hypothetical protein
MKMFNRGSRQQSVEALLDVETLPVTTDDYPESLNLPAYVYDRAVEAVVETADDIRERSVHFRYKKDQWGGGVAVRGSCNSVSWSHERLAILVPPHLHMHTHPPPNEYLAEEHINWSIKHDGQGRDIDTRIADWLRHIEQIFMFPSPADVFWMLVDRTRPAYLISSTGGHFLSLFTPDNFDNDAERSSSSYQWTTANEQALDLNRATAELRVAHHTEKPQQEVSNLHAKALAAAYVCYFSKDVNNPRLERIRPTE